MYQIAVTLVVLVHFVFICYVVLGGFVALRWRRTIWLHAGAVLWGAVSVLGHVGCPLTGLERWARTGAGMQPLASKGFIAHYITGLWYPSSWAGTVQVAAFALILGSWGWFVRQGRHSPKPVGDRRAATGPGQR